MMCRAQDHQGNGGRRCPGCNSPTARAAHNQRRRDNRKIRKNILHWAQDGRADTDTLKKIEGMPVDELKEWAVDHGAGLSLVRASRLDQGDQAAQPDLRGAKIAAPGAEAQEHLRQTFAAGGGTAAGDRPLKPGAAAAARPATTDDGTGSGSSRWTSVSDETAQRAERLMKTQGKTFQERALMRTDTASKDQRPLRQGVNETLRLSYKDGTTGYFKPFDGLDKSCAYSYGHQDNIQPMHEAAAWQLAREMGPPYSTLVSPCVIAEHEGRLGSISYGVMGRPLSRADTAVDDRQKNDAAFFDCLIGQQDRHPGNSLADNRGITLIDHGFAFSCPGRDYFNFTEFVRQRHARKDAHLSREEIGCLSTFLDSADGHGLKNYLEPARYEAVRWRAEQMLRKGRILKQDEMDLLARV